MDDEFRPYFTDDNGLDLVNLDLTFDGYLRKSVTFVL